MSVHLLPCKCERYVQVCLIYRTLCLVSNSFFLHRDGRFHFEGKEHHVVKWLSIREAGQTCSMSTWPSSVLDANKCKNLRSRYFRIYDYTTRSSLPSIFESLPSICVCWSPSQTSHDSVYATVASHTGIILWNAHHGLIGFRKHLRLIFLCTKSKTLACNSRIILWLKLTPEEEKIPISSTKIFNIP